MVSISRQEYIDLTQQINYWKAQHAKAKEKVEQLKQEILCLAGKIKDLQNRLFGKRCEKNNRKGASEKGSPEDAPRKPRGQQPNSKGHGRTKRPDLPIIHDKRDLPEEAKKCATCGLPHITNPALDEVSEIIEVNVAAHTRRIHRPGYTRNPGCSCEKTPAIITAPPPARLIPRSPYAVSFWVEVLLKKFQYGQPTNRLLQDLADQGLPVSAGTVAGGLHTIVPLFTPVMEALYCRQMNEPLFHNDETRWEVFVEIEGKNGSRWYLWVTRSKSVIYYCIDPSRSTAVPGAHFAGLQRDQVIIVCDRYSAYKKLARLSEAILLAFCWAHVRRDFLDAGRSFDTLEPWTLEWKEHIGTLYHLNKLRLAQWESDQPLSEQSAEFSSCQQAVKEHLQAMWDEANRAVSGVSGVLEENRQAGRKATSLVGVKGSAEKRQIKVYRSLLNHWSGLILFLENPEVPLDNNLAENSVRGPVTGRKAYYGSGSIWSAELAATLFSILQTLVLWGINPRHWLSRYLTACAENGGRMPDDITPFIPWQMDERRREILSRPQPP
ncbi:MAG: IS66 family transposase [Sedimenticola sp.]